MDCEKLISLVEEHVPLWDMRDKRYHRRDVQRKLWTKVAEEIGAQVEEVKRRWQGLRDTFRKEFNKGVEHRSGDGSENTGDSSWPYYNQMLFLKDVVSQRKLHANRSPKKNPTQKQHSPSTYLMTDIYSEEDHPSQQLFESDNPENGRHISTDTVSSQPSESLLRNLQPPSTPPVVSGGKRKRKTDTADQDPFIQIEKQKIQLLSDNATMRNNPDSLFLQSLLPFMMKVPQNRKLYVRNKLQQVFIDEEDRQSRMSYLTPPAASAFSPSSYSSASPVQQQNTYNEFLTEHPNTHMNSVKTYFTSFTDGQSTMQ